MKRGAIDFPGSLVDTWECTGTHIRCEKGSDMAFVLVVVDARPIVGHSIGPIADQVAMVALSRPGPRDGCSALPSILDALDPACTKDGPVTELTAYDEAYLKGLYAYRGKEILVFENSAIAKSMIEAPGLAPIDVVGTELAVQPSQIGTPSRTAGSVANPAIGP
jgi:hypothetical protein